MGPDGQKEERAPDVHDVHIEATAGQLVAEIVTIGDELNRGEIVDTNAAWLGEQLTDLGLDVRYRQGCNDRQDDIVAVLGHAAARSHVVLVSGGLGPTQDDLTVDVAAGLLGVPALIEPAHEERLRARLAERNMPLMPNGLRQVRLPQGTYPLQNHHGLAPGFQANFRDLGPAAFFFMPGVPREMKPMFQTQVVPRLRAVSRIGLVSARRSYRVIGLGESHVDHRLRGLLGEGKDPALSMGPFNPSGPRTTIHFRLAFPEVLVTLVARGENEAAAQSELDRLEPELRRRLGGALYSEGPADLPIVVGRKLLERNETVATAESCTGGMIGELLTAVPGSSAYFLGGVISYANAVKTGVLGVSEATLREHGAVSRACVEEMARGVQRLTGATYGVAVSGVAGPEGGTPDKPVGTVHLAVAGPGEVVTRHLLWPAERDQVRRIAAFAALNVLHKILVPERAVKGDGNEPGRDRLG